MNFKWQKKSVFENQKKKYKYQFLILGKLLIFGKYTGQVSEFYAMRPKSRKSNPRPPKSEKVKHPRTSHSSPKKTHENLPNEILTQIFEYLTLKELVRCGNTCQRWKLVISNTEKVWKMANLTNKIVPVSFLNHLSLQGTKYLSLQDARLINDEEFSDIQGSKFTHLNLYHTRGFQ